MPALPLHAARALFTKPNPERIRSSSINFRNPVQVFWPRDTDAAWLPDNQPSAFKFFDMPAEQNNSESPGRIQSMKAIEIVGCDYLVKIDAEAPTAEEMPHV